MIDVTASRRKIPERRHVQLRILATTDLHLRVLPYDYFRKASNDRYGLARTARLISAAREEAANTLLFDNGDFFCGLPQDLGIEPPGALPPAPGDHPMVAILNTLGYDAVNLGNHDFDNGIVPAAARPVRGAFSGPVGQSRLCPGRGRASRPGGTPFPGTLMLERTVTDSTGAPAELKIGVLGVLPPGTIPQSDTNGGQIVVDDLLETAMRTSRDLRAEGADLVVVLAHTGIAEAGRSRTAENAAGLLAALGGIDAVIAGHRHQLFPGDPMVHAPGIDHATGTIHGVPVVCPGFWGSHLGLIDFDLSLSPHGIWSVESGRASTRTVAPAEDGSDPGSDEAITALMAPAHAETLRQVDRPVGHTVAPITSFFALAGPNAAVQTIQRAKLWYVRQRCAHLMRDDRPVLAAGCAYKTGGLGEPGDFTRIEPGPLTIRDVADLYPFPNHIAFLELTGTTLREWLERAASVHSQIRPGTGIAPLKDDMVPGYFFDTILGVTYGIDLTAPPRYTPFGTLLDPRASRVRNLCHQGKPVRDDDRFTLVTNTYRAGGGGSYPEACLQHRLRGPNPEIREVLIAYFGAHPMLTPIVEQHWQLLPAGGARVEIAVAPEARLYLPPAGAIDVRPAAAPDPSGYLNCQLML